MQHLTISSVQKGGLAFSLCIQMEGECLDPPIFILSLCVRAYECIFACLLISQDRIPKYLSTVIYIDNRLLFITIILAPHQTKLAESDVIQQRMPVVCQEFCRPFLSMWEVAENRLHCVNGNCRGKHDVGWKKVTSFS